ncbi:MAG: hypothetical protein AAGN82_26910, partial [Myxococcota bacterium]
RGADNGTAGAEAVAVGPPGAGGDVGSPHAQSPMAATETAHRLGDDAATPRATPLMADRGMERAG